MLKEEGFARLPRRRGEERLPGPRPEVAEVADVNRLDLSVRRFRTQFGGLYLFVPYLAQIPLERLLEEAGFPGTNMISAEQAILSLLGLKLFGSARHSHVMSYVLDEDRLCSRGQRGPQAVFSHRIQLSDRSGFVSPVDAAVV